MRYAMLLKPHANPRYRQSLHTLALRELSCTLNAWGIEAEPACIQLGGEGFLTFETDEMTPEAWAAVSANAGCCFACEMQGGALFPKARTGPSYLPNELSQVLKYKGKTNPDFTLMLLHCALAASDFGGETQPLTVLDPACGKGTTLFCALQEGYNAVGADVDQKALEEADVYLERFLKLNRFKHKRGESSLTLPKGGGVRQVRYALSAAPEAFKAGDTRELRLIDTQAFLLGTLLRPGSCHLAVCDMPYGIQHAPKEGKQISSLERLLSEIAVVCAKALADGGALALSFNDYTLSRRSVLSAVQAAGLRPLVEPPFVGFAHWVEQAVNRDVVIARKESAR